MQYCLYCILFQGVVRNVGSARTVVKPMAVHSFGPTESLLLDMSKALDTGCLLKMKAGASG
ncbi:MAG: hypothetical protein PVI54_17995, partial [Desulfobacteraceae bacterium]